MTKLGEMIWDDGLKEVIEQGKQMATERYSRLILLLSKEQKEDLIVKLPQTLSTWKNCIKNMISDDLDQICCI